MGLGPKALTPQARREAIGRAVLRSIGALPAD